MENKVGTNDYTYILNMNILPEFDDTTGEFFWNNNQTNFGKKNDNNDEIKKEQENKEKIDDNFLKENATKFIEELKGILNNN